MKPMYAMLTALTLLAAPAAAQDGGTWTKGTPVIEARAEIGMAEAGGKVFIVGGYNSPAELLVYDIAADRWSRGAALPRPVHHPAAVGLDGKLYAIGGYVDGWGPSDDLLEYDPAADRWQKLPPMPTARGALAAAVIDGKIHAVSGVGPVRGERKNSPAHEVYDRATRQWTKRAPIPTPRDHLAVAALGGKLYAIAGRVDGSYGRNLADNEAYDPKTDRWEKKAPIPTARSGIAAAVLNGRIIVVGGEGTGGTFKEVEAYDPAADRWTALAPLPSPRHGLGAVAIGSRLHVIAGGPTPGGSSSTTHEILQLK